MRVKSHCNLFREGSRQRIGKGTNGGIRERSVVYSTRLKVTGNVLGDRFLAVMDVESRFDRYAVSRAGAVGLMQIMPFWPNELGMTNDQLIRIAENVRMGTTILGYYLRKERGNYPRALQRYNGSLGRSTYSNLVLDRLVARWRYEL